MSGLSSVITVSENEGGCGFGKRWNEYEAVRLNKWVHSLLRSRIVLPVLKVPNDEVFYFMASQL